MKVAIPRRIVDALPDNAAGKRQAIFVARLATMAMAQRRGQEGRFHNYHHKTLRPMLGGNYRQHIREMIDAGFIEPNKSKDGRREPYLPGVLAKRKGKKPFSKSYRLVRRYLTQPFTTVDITGKEQQAIVRGHRAFDRDNLKTGGLHYVSQFPQFSIHPSFRTDTTLANRYTQASVVKVANRDHYANRCDYGRLHTTFTSFPSDARRHLRAGGNRVSEVDIGAAQLLLLGLLAAVASVSQTGVQDVPQPGPNPTNSADPLLSVAAQFSRRDWPQDVRLWTDLCEAGTVYDYLLLSVVASGQTKSLHRAASGYEYPRDLREAGRAEIKQATIVALFERVGAMKRSPVYLAIEREFPTIARVMRDAKANGHEALACRLQSLEAALMIDRLGELLSKNYPDEPVSPIHDALLVRQSFAEEAAMLIRQVFATVGLIPAVKIERL